jgi:hypothetical protein
MATYLVERLLNTQYFHSAVIIAPQCQIVAAFTHKEDMIILPHQDVTLGYTSVLEGVTVQSHHWFQDEIDRRERFVSHVTAKQPARRTLITTHQAVSRWFSEDEKLLPVNLAGRLLVVDEAHHASSGNGVGTFTQAWLNRGGAVIHMTATPFRSDEDLIINNLAPRWTRTLADHIETGEFAPSIVRIRSVLRSLPI